MTKPGLELRPADSYLRQMILSLCLVSTMYGIPQYGFCLLFSCGWAIISCFFVCLVIFFLLKTGQFEYYSLITLEIRFSSFLRVCCCCLLGIQLPTYVLTFSNFFFLQRLHSLPCVIVEVSITLFH